MSRKPWQHNGKSRQERGYGVAHDRMREHLLRNVILCEECQRKDPPRVTPGYIADHVIPLAKGGTGDRSNYELLCRDCADEKDARDRGVRRKLRIAADGWPVDD